MNHSDEPQAPGDDEADVTSVHLRRAREGEQASLAWVVAHFTPFLQAQAEYRIQGGMRRLHDPGDLVDEVWMVVLPRVAELRPRDGHCTPVLMKFLATTLLNRLNNHLTRYLRAGTRSLSPSSSPSQTGRAVDPPESPSVTSVVGKVARSEARQLLHEALERLDPDERELLVLRGIEQHPNQDVARRLGVDPSTVTKRCQRVLQKLRARLPGSILDQLPS